MIILQANSILGRALFGLLGLVVTELDILLGLNCDPIGIGSVGSDDCSATPVCCVNNSVVSHMSRSFPDKYDVTHVISRMSPFPLAVL